jgi:hypothetical protein
MVIPLTDKNENIRKLYEDALYWHFIGKGYSDERARFEAKHRTGKHEEPSKETE